MRSLRQVNVFALLTQCDEPIKPAFCVRGFTNEKGEAPCLLPLEYYLANRQIYPADFLYFPLQQQLMLFGLTPITIAASFIESNVLKKLPSDEY